MVWAEETLQKYDLDDLGLVVASAVKGQDKRPNHIIGL